MSSIVPLRNHLLHSLPSADLDTLLPHLETVELVREAVVVKAGRPLTHVWLPHSGVISLVVRLSAGETVQVAMVGSDSAFGAAAALDGLVSLTDAVVVVPGTASLLAVADLRAAAARSVAFRTLFVRHEQALLAQAQQAAACNACHSVEARLSRWLLRARDLSDIENLPLTQEFMAQMIGVQRNAVSVVAHALQQAGIIRYSRGHLAITDLSALKAASCECYQAVKAPYDRLLQPAG